MRLFFAVEIPEEVRATLRRGIGELKRDLPPARWVRAEGIHVTLKFLGELGESAVPPLEAATSAAQDRGLARPTQNWVSCPMGRHRGRAA